jgi:DNA polymerase III subunit beta
MKLLSTPLRTIVEPKYFKNAIANLASISGGRNSSVSENCVLFDLKGNQLCLEAKSNVVDLKCVIPMKSPTIAERQFLVPLTQLAPFVSMLPDESIRLSFIEKGLQIECGNIKSLTPLQDMQLWNYETQEILKLSTSISADSLLDALRVSYAVDENHQVFNGIEISWKTSKKPSITVSSADSMRLACVSFLEEHKLDKKIFLHWRTIEPLKQFLKNANNQILNLGFQDGSLYLEYCENRIRLSLHSNNFPSLEKIIPKKFSTEIYVNRISLIEAVKRLELYGESPNNKRRVEVVAKLGKLIIRAQGDNGEATQDISAYVTGTYFSKVFQANCILEALRASSASRILLRFDELQKMAIYDETYFALIMGIK